MPTRRAQLSPAPFRFEMGMRRGDLGFFQNSVHDEPALAERARWLAADPARYTAATAASETLVANANAFALAANPTLAAASDLLELGCAWTPDFLILAPDETGVFVLRAGCVCFPSHWDLREKIGRPLAEIHAPVPTLNASLARQIDSFLAALKTGIVWERWNWGLAATPERNMHPALSPPRITADTSLERLWFRTEHQAFVRLPATGAILFAIRVVVEPLTATIQARGEAAHFAEILASMSEEIAHYKGFGTGRAALIERLRAIA